MYQGKIYHGGENGYAKTGIVDFPQGNSVFVCVVVVLRPRLTSMVMSGRLVYRSKLFLLYRTKYAFGRTALVTESRYLDSNKNIGGAFKTLY